VRSLPASRNPDCSSVFGGEGFQYVFKPGRHGPDAPPLHPASARSRFAPRARRATRARHGVCGCAVVASGRGSAHYAEPLPQRPSPLGVPIRPAPPQGRSLSSDHHRGNRVTLGGAGRIGSKRLDPGAPTTPRPASAGRPRACRRARASPPLPLFHGQLSTMEIQCPTQYRSTRSGTSGG
jgi:hypothetical protein